MTISNQALAAAAATLVLTVVHHVHGALVYATPWRLHVLFVAVPTLLVLVLAHAVHRRHRGATAGRVAAWCFVVLAVVVPVTTIGLIEGGYNHLVKNVLFFAGASEPALLRMFPPPAYELPNDFWFEATGILQFFVGLSAAHALLRPPAPRGVLAA